MTDEQRSGEDDYARLTGLLVATGDAHHAATAGGPDHDWSEWYAGYLAGRIDPLVGFSPDEATILRWLRDADERYRAEEPDEEWPEAYARYVLDEYAASHGR